MDFKYTQYYLTHNECYISGKKMTPAGIVVHSTGANNTMLRRYIGPDDGKLGKNLYNNHWNQVMGNQVCVHAFIGRLDDGSIACYQTLPWDMVGWHSGGGKNGSANRLGYIGFEICEDNLTDASYFNAVYDMAAHLCAYLCTRYNIPIAKVICHSEAASMGIASFHADVMHWFPRFGKNMDTFRKYVRTLINGSSPVPTPTPTFTPYRVRVTTDGLNYRSGPSTQYEINGVITDRGIYTIVEEKDGWGRLKSGAGWIYLGYTAKVGGTSAPAPTYRSYTVKSGDTLWGIAADKLNSGMRYTEIKLMNNLKSDLITPGMMLKIPLK